MQLDLFSYAEEQRKETGGPLAARMRPQTLEEVVGQSHILGKGKLLYRAIKADRLGSVIFYGPPGTGKTSIARVIANTTSASFVQLNATTSGKKDMEECVARAKSDRAGFGRKTILFIDEIHRFNKGQQDYLLPFVEDGTITLIGATTENPYFEVNPALLSRSMIFELKPISREDMVALIGRSVTSPRGMAPFHAVLDEGAAEYLADFCGGDARAALNAVELGVLTSDPSEDGLIHLSVEVLSECIQKRAIRYDKNGDHHYDTISAFIKSMRGSDPDAALYYLARMIEAGEDPVFIARRVMIAAAEDVGNADPNALRVAVSASLACERIGWPEGKIILAQAVEYVACAPKSNAAAGGIFAAEELVKETGDLPIPPYLMDAHYSHAGDLGRGVGYLYPHSYEGHYVEQQYLPDAVKDRVLYRPGELGYEKTMRTYLEEVCGKHWE